MNPWVAAHSRNQEGKRQALGDHLRQVAALARDFASQFGAGVFAYYAGLWHDIGKVSPVFQEYLARCEAGEPARSCDHKAAGAILATRHMEPAALLVQGHHGGLRSPADVKDWLAEKRRTDQPEAVLQAALEAFDYLEPKHPGVEVPAYASEPLPAEFFLRMAFSALVDADYLDTERHFAQDKAARRGSASDLGELWRRFEAYHSDLQQHSGTGAVADIRREVYEACLAAADLPPGVFSLTVPTGGGKTLSSMAFALRHALKNGQRRVIVVVPLLAITEQTASILRRAFSDTDAENPAVLEHHSAVADPSEEDSGDYRQTLLWRRLAAENWDVPIVVTTTVQFFESLFSAATSKVRKLHRIANSIVILDEVQALPTKLLEPILDALRELAANYNTTILLTTATQPAFDAIASFEDVRVTEIAPNPARLFETLRRVDYEWRIVEPLSWETVAGIAREADQALAIVNTKADAMQLLDALRDRDALHLSTQLCGAHRRRVIEEVQERLREGSPCRLVSTQAVEAGVDLDFPLVLRALGPLHSIIQAAGRCNREGRFDSGRMIVFRPPAGAGIPGGSYRTATDLSARLYAEGKLDPHSVQRIREYFQLLFQTVELDARRIQDTRKRLDYPQVATDFRMIDDDSISVVVHWGDESSRREVAVTLEGLSLGSPAERYLFRRLQPYLVSLPAREEQGLLAGGLVSPVVPGLFEWLGGYDEVRGLVKAGSSAEALIA